MIIDTDKLRETIGDYFNEKEEAINHNIKSDYKAIKILTDLETRQLKLLNIINEIETLHKQFCKEELSVSKSNWDNSLTKKIKQELIKYLNLSEDHQIADGYIGKLKETDLNFKFSDLILIYNENSYYVVGVVEDVTSQKIKPVIFHSIIPKINKFGKKLTQISLNNDMNKDVKKFLMVHEPIELTKPVIKKIEKFNITLIRFNQKGDII